MVPSLQQQYSSLHNTQVNQWVRNGCPTRQDLRTSTRHERDRTISVSELTSDLLLVLLCTAPLTSVEWSTCTVRSTLRGAHRKRILPRCALSYTEFTFRAVRMHGTEKNTQDDDNDDEDLRVREMRMIPPPTTSQHPQSVSVFAHRLIDHCQW